MLSKQTAARKRDSSATVVLAGAVCAAWISRLLCMRNSLLFLKIHFLEGLYRLLISSSRLDCASSYAFLRIRFNAEGMNGLYLVGKHARRGFGDEAPIPHDVVCVSFPDTQKNRCKPWAAAIHFDGSASLSETYLRSYAFVRSVLAPTLTGKLHCTSSSS